MRHDRSSNTLNREVILTPGQLKRIKVGTYATNSSKPEFSFVFESVADGDCVTYQPAEIGENGSATYELTYSLQNFGQQTVKLVVKWVGGQRPLLPS